MKRTKSSLEAMLAGAWATPDFGDTNVEHIKAAMELKPLTGLVYGDLIKGVKKGQEWVSIMEDKPVVFVRYEDNTRLEGSAIYVADIVIAAKVNVDGSVGYFAVDSRFYEPV